MDLKLPKDIKDSESESRHIPEPNLIQRGTSPRAQQVGSGTSETVQSAHSTHHSQQSSRSAVKKNIHQKSIHQETKENEIEVIDLCSDSDTSKPSSPKKNQRRKRRRKQIPEPNSRQRRTWPQVHQGESETKDTDSNAEDDQSDFCLSTRHSRRSAGSAVKKTIPISASGSKQHVAYKQVLMAKHIHQETKEENKVDLCSDSDTLETSSHKKNEREQKRHRKTLTEINLNSPQESKDEKNEVKCPVPGCNSAGHLSGKFPFHFTTTACPIFHNTTPTECEQRYEMYTQKMVESTRIVLENCQLCEVSPRTEEKEGYKEVLEHRHKSYPQNEQKSTAENQSTQDFDDKSREPDLSQLTSSFDLEMFKEAQARAAETFEGHQKLVTKSKKSGISVLVMGRYEMDVLYSSPYPAEYQCLSKLYLCEFCLKYMNSPTVLRRHSAKCVWRYPMGDEIYRKENISFFEVDGQKSKTYCQNLCLLSKLFLDYKTLYFDVDTFLFYVMTESDHEGCHIIGYFSKEKNSHFNVSCILTLPPFQRQGFGRMLIDFSYLLSKVEQKVGSPEKPLSDLGLISYRSYWKSVVFEYLSRHEGMKVSIKDISNKTAIETSDIISTLQAMGLVKYWKGQHIIMRKQELLDKYMAKARERRADRCIDPSYLKWSPRNLNG